MNRRRFLKTAALVTAVSQSPLLAGALHPVPARAEGLPDLCAGMGSDLRRMTAAAVEGLGGMSRFVKPGDRVGLLVNCAFRRLGSVTHPAAALTVAGLCREAGAGSVIMLHTASDSYWKKAAPTPDEQDLIAGLSPNRDRYKSVDIPQGLAMRNALVMEDILNVDVFINMPIIKHHEGVQYTGALKNMMGLAPYLPTCNYMHRGSGGSGWYGDIDHLAQCIADLNLVRRPDLIVMDASEFLASNGPSGPGRMAKADRVIAGTDPVAVDAHTSRFLDLDPKTLPTIVKAVAHDWGEPDPARVVVKEIAA